jgi:hypothetical protein
MNELWEQNKNSDSVASSKPDRWLYEIDGSVYGPVSKEVIVEKIRLGEIEPSQVKVARENTDFFVVTQVAAFGSSLEELGDLRQSRGRRKVRLALVLLSIGILGATYGGYIHLEHKKSVQNEKRAQRLSLLETKMHKEARQRQKILRGNMELVALVSFDESRMKIIKSPAKKKKRGGRNRKGALRQNGKPKPGGGLFDDDDSVVSRCKRSQKDIFGVLRNNLRKINFCVSDEKKRNGKAALPESLKLSFVARPSGTVSDFTIIDRHYRKGPMRNCMLKVFRAIRFPQVGGSNCPVQIPVKIGR